MLLFVRCFALTFLPLYVPPTTYAPTWPTYTGPQPRHLRAYVDVGGVQLERFRASADPWDCWASARVVCQLVRGGNARVFLIPRGLLTL